MYINYTGDPGKLSTLLSIIIYIITNENFFVTFFYSDYSTSPIDKFELDGKRKTKREKNEIKTKN